MHLIFSPSAYQDLSRIYAFLAKTDPGAVAKAGVRLKQAFLSLSKYPLAGYPLGDLPRFRELIWPFGKGHYVIRYRLEKDAVNIVHLWHSREDRLPFRAAKPKKPRPS